MRRQPHDANSRLHQAVGDSLAAHVPQGAALALGLSGGRDSVVLLDLLAAIAPPRGHTVAAIHVHHGLSANADAWAQFCVDRCATLGLACVVRRVSVAREPRTSLEAMARRARYDALAEASRELGAPVVALAHHQDDQAETLLLQLLRGAGPHGLAAMPALRKDASGALWWRPLLDAARADINAYARDSKLTWIDDESNADARHARNAVRQTVLPALRELAPQAATTLARAAAHQAEAARLLDELAEQDAHDLHDGRTLSRAGLALLAPHRARNLLRWFLKLQGLPAPSTARLADMLAQVTHARGDANVRIAHAGVELGVFRGRVTLHACPPPDFDVRWQGESELALPHGRLVFARTLGGGIDADRLAAAPVNVRPRAGGERLKLASDRPRRVLCDLLHDAGMPPWDRESLPLVFCGGALAAVPGLGIDIAFRAASGAPGYRARMAALALTRRVANDGAA